MQKKVSELQSLELFTSENGGLRPFGRVVDLLFDDDSWKVRYLVVQVESPLSGRVLVSPSVTTNVDFEEHRIESTQTAQQIAETPLQNNGRLLSAAEICGYTVESQIGPAGRLEDLVIDMKSWIADYAKADSVSWLATQSSMFSTTRISEVNWKTHRIHVDLQPEVLQPVFPSAGLNTTSRN